MMAKLKCLNLDLHFKTFYKTNPVQIKYKNKFIQDSCQLKIETVKQLEQISFSGFVPQDKDQKVVCQISYNNIVLEDPTPFVFEMHNNLYVENKTINNYKEIHFNGKLNLNFDEKYFKHNLLNGANLWKHKGYINWEDKFNDSQIFCVGDSFTFGHGVAPEHSWPGLLETYTKQQNCNFGSKGLSHDGCLMNTNYILDTSKKVQDVICLMPPPTRKLFLFDFLDMHGGITLSHSFDYKFPIEYTNAKKQCLEKILNKDYISEDWLDACIAIVKACDAKNVRCLISTWDKEMYTQIPAKNRLPIFPDLDIFPERASDNNHPHRKHYELFVQKILPYIDKK